MKRRIDVKTLNKQTKKAQDFIDRYYKSNSYSVNESYKQPSIYKRNIENEILNDMKEVDGKGYKVIGAGSTYFSAGYLITDVNDKKRILVIETPTSTYYIPELEMEDIYDRQI